MDNVFGINESSGIGQGLAQVFNPYTPQYDAGEIGMVEYKKRLAEEEAKRKKQEKLGKITENIKTPLMPPDYLKLFDSTRNELLEYAYKGDLDNVVRLKGELENIGMLGKAIYEDAKGKSNTVLQQPAGSFEGVDVFEDIFKGGKPITKANIYDVSTDYMNRLQGIQRKEKPFDVTTEYNQLQNIINPKQEGRRTFVDEAMAKDGIKFAITTDPQWNKFAQAQFAAADPQEQAKYNGDYVAWGTDNLYKPLLKEVRTPEPKDQSITVNVGGGNEGVTENKVTEQVIPIGRGVNEGRNVTARVFTYPQPVNLGAGVSPSDMFMIDQTTGQTQYLKGQDTPEISFNQTVEVPVAAKDVKWVGADGKQREIKKGEIIAPQDAKYASEYLKEDIPTTTALYSIGFDKDNNKYYRPAEQVAPATIAHFYGAKGETAKSQFIKEGIEQTPNKKKKKAY